MSGQILVVEDNENLRHDLQKAVIFDAPNRRVVTVRNEFEAGQLLAEIPFDVVITDIKLDEAGGTEVGGLKVLRAVHQKDPMTPVIVVTAFGKKEIPADESSDTKTTLVEEDENADAETTSVEEMARRLGAFAYIERPHPVRDYLDVIREVVTLALQQRGT